MLENLIQDVQGVPTRLRTGGARLLSRIQAAPVRLAKGRSDAEKWVQTRTAGLRAAGETRAWELQVSAIEQAGTLFQRGEELPVIGGIAHRASELLKSVEMTALAPPIEGYDDCSVRDVLKVLHTIDRIGLLRLTRYEASHKNRKTILDAARKELDRREKV
jgi:hypothetical protein